MTCEPMLVAILDADPNELAGLGDSAVALHLRTCARCRAVAGRVLDETHLLADAVARADAAPGATVRRSVARARLARPLVVGGVLAAALLAFAVLERPRSAPVFVEPVFESRRSPQPPPTKAPVREGASLASRPPVASCAHGHRPPFPAVLPPR